MRKIHVTESQLQYCLENCNKNIDEATNQGAGVQVAAKTDNNGRVTQQTLATQNHDLDAQGLNNAQIVVDQDTLMEGCDVYTKKQLKEARKNKLVKESNKKFTKKQLEEAYEEPMGWGYNNDYEPWTSDTPKPDEDEEYLRKVVSKLEDISYWCGHNFASASMNISDANYWRKVGKQIETEYMPYDRTGYAEEIVKIINEMLSQIQIYDPNNRK